MRVRTLADVPPLDVFKAIACPIERAAQLTAVAADRGTLPGPHAALRDSSLLAGKALPRPDGQPHTLTDLARRTGVSLGRVWQLIQRARLAVPDQPA